MNAPLWFKLPATVSLMVVFGSCTGHQKAEILHFYFAYDAGNLCLEVAIFDPVK